jgi:hypothetical protein
MELKMEHTVLFYKHRYSNTHEYSPLWTQARTPYEHLQMTGPTALEIYEVTKAPRC